MPLSVRAALAVVLALVASAAGARSRLVTFDAAAAPDLAVDPLAPARSVQDALRARGQALADTAALIPLATAHGAGGVRFTRIEQLVGGVPVFRGSHVVATREDGTLLAVVLGEPADAGLPGPELVDAATALARAHAHVSGSPLPPGVTLGEGRAGAGWLEAAGTGLEPPVMARRVVLAEGPTAAWRVELPERDDPSARWCVLVDATAGHVLAAIDVADEVAARARVFPRSPAFPSEMRDLVDGEALMDVASPEGWLAADQTLGNNASVWEDRAGDGTATPGAVATGTGDPLTFDFPFTGVPADDLDAALANAFWLVNDVHDRFWRLGFDEPAGNGQARNFARGGVENDALRVFVQSRAGASGTGVRNLASAFAGVDGSAPSLTLSLWDRSGELRDGAFDAGVVVHELAHVVVTRMAGGDATCDDGLQPAALGEGWADYFAASFTGQTVLGAWVTGNAVNGLRTQPIDGVGYSYANLCSIGGNYCSSTENGEIWAGALWELRSALMAEHGAAEGALRADRLVVEALRYTPCRPTFPEARDALVLADQALHGGADQCLVWSVMAGRGVGASATTTGPDDRYPLPAFDLPPECRSGSRVAWDRPRYGDDADAVLRVADASAGTAPRSVRVTSSGGDSETLAAVAEPSTSGRLRRLVVPIRPGAPAPGDGILQVLDGAAVEATCTDCPGMPRAAATIGRGLAVSVVTHSLSAESCHDDDDAAGLADFRNELPSVLDAGELATNTVTLGNAERFALEDVRVTVTCDDPDVQVLPRGEIVVGRVPARHAGPWPFNVTLRMLAAPSPAVAAGDVATLRFRVRARGLEGETVLAMPLARDYRDERAVPAFGGTETFEPGSPTAGQWTHAPAFGRPADPWGIQDCGNGGGRAMVAAGNACGLYSDEASAATLVSPPLFDLSGEVQAVHFVQLSWMNDVRLGWDPRSGYCDSEMVLLYTGSDPNRPAYANPVGDRNNATQYWANWPGLGNSRNTTGWAAAAPRVALTTGSFANMDLSDVRLRWVFMTDVYDPDNDGGCRITDPDAVGEGYRLDDVSFTYDLARLVPAADTACAQGCGVRAALAVSPPGGSRCAGEALLLDASASEAAGCAGALEYRFTGPGLNTGYTPSATATTAAADGATWTVAVRCATDTACSQSVSVADRTRDDAAGGRLRADSLRVRRDGDDVVLRWDGTRAPIAYALFGATAPRLDADARRAALTDLASPPPPDALRLASPDALEHRLSGPAARTGVTYYRVLARVPCAGTALSP